MSSELFDRDISLVVAGQRISMRPKTLGVGEYLSHKMLRCAFSVSKSTSSANNTASATIWNLNKQHRGMLSSQVALYAKNENRFTPNEADYRAAEYRANEAAAETNADAAYWARQAEAAEAEAAKAATIDLTPQLIIDAGYVDTIQQIFSGDITRVNHTFEGPHWMTQVECGDGIKAMSTSRINLSFKSGVSVEKVLSTLVNQLGVGVGNALEKFKEGKFKKGLKEFTRGITLKGKVKQSLDKFMKKSGFDWSIQDGQLQVLKPDETMPTTATVLTSENNSLIGSPELGENGYIRAKCLMRGYLLPGYPIKIESREINGFFKITGITHSGDTEGNEWYTEIEGKPIE